MKIILAALIAFVLISTTSFSQQQYIGFKIGPGFTNVGGSLFKNTGARTGLNFGFTYEYFMVQNLSLGAEILYTQRGFKDDFYMRDQMGNDVGSKTADFNYDYISIPIKVTYSGNAKFYGFYSVGLIPAFIVSAKTKIPAFDGIPEQTVDVKENVTQVDVAGMIEVGGGYQMAPQYKVFISVTGQLSFNQISNNEYFSEETMHHRGTMVMAGIKYAVSKAK